jgi:hypothetical protein
MGDDTGKPKFVKSMEECQTVVKGMDGVDPMYYYASAIVCPDNPNEEAPDWCRLAQKFIAAQPTGPIGTAIQRDNVNSFRGM